MSDSGEQPDRKAPATGRFTRLLRAVGSLRIAVILILLLALYCLPGVFPAVYAGWLGIRQIEYYGGPLLWVLCAAFCVNLLACTLDRLLFRRRGSVGLVLTHASILLLAVGAAWYAFGAVSGELLLHLGEQTDHYYTDTPALHVRWPGAGRTEVYPLTGVREGRSGMAHGPVFVRPSRDAPALQVVDYAASARLDLSPAAHPKAAHDPMILCRVEGHGLRPRTAWLRAGGARGDSLTGNGWLLRCQWVDGERALRERIARPPGSGVLHVRFRDDAYEAFLPAAVGRQLRIPRFGYLLTVERTESMTGRGTGTTPACVLRIDTPTRSLRRYMLARFPEFSDDDPIPADSRPASQAADAHGLIDTRLSTEYYVELLLVVGPKIAPRLIHPLRGGAEAEAPLAWGTPRTIPVLDQKLTLTALKLVERPLMQVTGGDPIDAPGGMPALLVRSADGQFKQWLPSRPYAGRAEPLQIPYQGELAEVTFSRVRRPLGFRVALTDFRVETYPGGEVPKDFVARLRLDDERDAEARLNAPVDFGGLSLYQSSYGGYPDPDGRIAASVGPWTYSILSVSRKPGLGLIYLGFAGIVLGVLVSFFVQPLFRRRRDAADSKGAPS